jgi:hypothetical protein
MAQPGQPMVWQPVEKNAIQLLLPPDWTPTDEVAAPNALLVQAPTPDVSLSVTRRVLDRVLPLEEFALATLREYTADNGYTLMSVLPVVLPIGAAQRFESLRVVRGVRLRLVQYFIIVNTTLVTLQGVLPDEPTLAAAPFIEIFDRAASTLRLNDAALPAPAFFTDATGGLRLWLPPEWEVAARDNAVLTFAQPAYKAVFTVTYRRLETAPLLVEIAQAFLNTYAAQNITVEAFEVVNLPIGETYRAVLANVPAQAAGGRTLLTKQYQWIVLRDNWLVVMNAGSETIYFDTIAPIVLRMADTLEFAGL